MENLDLLYFLSVLTSFPTTARVGVWGRGEWAASLPFPCPGGWASPLESTCASILSPLASGAPSSLFCSRQSVLLDRTEEVQDDSNAGQSPDPTTKAATPSLKPCSVVCLKCLRLEFCNCQLEETHSSTLIWLYLKWAPCGQHPVGSCVLLTPPSPLFQSVYLEHLC